MTPAEDQWNVHLLSDYLIRLIKALSGYDLFIGRAGKTTSYIVPVDHLRSYSGCNSQDPFPLYPDGKLLVGLGVDP